MDGVRTIPTNVHSELTFNRCDLWADLYDNDGHIWSDSDWTRLIVNENYKPYFDNFYHIIDTIFSETVTSNFGIAFETMVSYQ